MIQDLQLSNSDNCLTMVFNNLYLSGSFLANDHKLGLNPVPINNNGSYIHSESEISKPGVVNRLSHSSYVGLKFKLLPNQFLINFDQ